MNATKQPGNLEIQIQSIHNLQQSLKTPYLKKYLPDIDNLSAKHSRNAQQLLKISKYQKEISQLKDDIQVRYLIPYFLHSYDPFFFNYMILSYSFYFHSKLNINNKIFYSKNNLNTSPTITMNKLLGGAMMMGSLAVFTYYTAWVFYIPKAKPNDVLSKLFLDKNYAVCLPLCLFFLFIGFVFTYIMRYELKVRAEKAKTTQKKQASK